MTNTGQVPLLGPVSIYGDGMSVSCPDLTTIGNLDDWLQPNETIICSRFYNITSADLVAGNLTINAMASVGGVTSNLVTSILTAASQTSTPTLLETAQPTLASTPTIMLTKTPIIANIGFYKPNRMKLGETINMVMLLSPSYSKSDLLTEIPIQSGLVTSTSEPGQFMIPGGPEVEIETYPIEATRLVKAELKSLTRDAFDIEEIHDSPILVVNNPGLTEWEWGVTAKQKGEYTLVLIVYQLIKYEDTDKWTTLETFKADINVEVTIMEQLMSWDWQWFLTFILALSGTVFEWLRRRKHKSEQTSQKSRNIFE